MEYSPSLTVIASERLFKVIVILDRIGVFKEIGVLKINPFSIFISLIVNVYLHIHSLIFDIYFFHIRNS